MATQSIISANPRRNNGGTVVQAGNIASDSPITKNVSVRDNALFDGYGSKVFKAVSPTSSGNIGTAQPLSGGTFGYQQVAGEYVGKIIGTKISGVANTTLQSGAADFAGRKAIHLSESNRRLHITSWDYVTGAATKGGSAGNVMSFGTDDAARPTAAVPGELVYLQGPIIPLQDNYKARTNP